MKLSLRNLDRGRLQPGHWLRCPWDEPRVRETLRGPRVALVAGLISVGAPIQEDPIVG